MLTVSAVFSAITRSHWDFGTASALPCASVMDSRATGVQYTPRLAKVAYAFAMVSGDMPSVPSAMAGTSGSFVPSAGITPSFVVISVTGQSPSALSEIISTKYVLTDLAIASLMPYGPTSDSDSFSTRSCEVLTQGLSPQVCTGLGYSMSCGDWYVLPAGTPRSRAAAATNGLKVEPVGKPKFDPPIRLSTEKLICVSFLPKPYGLDWPIARTRPVPGCTRVTAVATLSSWLTWSLIDSLTDSCDCGSSVVRTVRPPWFQSLARSSRVLPNTGSVRNVLRT